MVEMFKEPFFKSLVSQKFGWLFSKVKSWGLSIDRGIELNPQICIVLDEVEKPGNLGAIIRTAEKHLELIQFLSDSSLDYFNPNVVRSSE